MGRISRQVLMQYKELESKFHGCCYYCNTPHAHLQNELTPSHQATDVAKGEFEGEWTCAKVCNSCWAKIYKANIILCGAKFRVRAGTMTLDMKRTLLGLAPKDRAPDSPVEWVKNGTYMVPAGTLLGEEGDYFCNEKRLTSEEMDALQPVMTCIMHKRPLTVSHTSLAHAMSSGDLLPEREDLYRAILNLPITARYTGGVQWD